MRSREIARSSLDRTAPQTGQHEILAVGRLNRLPTGQQAAVLVSDRYQHPGLRAEVVRRLIKVARHEQLQEVVAFILPENLRMRALANQFNFKIRPSEDPTKLSEVLDLSRSDTVEGLNASQGLAYNWCWHSRAETSRNNSLPRYLLTMRLT